MDKKTKDLGQKSEIIEKAITKTSDADVVSIIDLSWTCDVCGTKNEYGNRCKKCGSAKPKRRR